MRFLMIFALALVWGTGILAQEVASENETTEKATAVPTTIDFQGRLHDSGGNPVNATLNITFAIYDVEAGGVPFWAETHTAVDVLDGLFQVTLGTYTPVDPSFFAASDSRWLGIQVGSEAEMSPRTKFSSVGYALQSGGASNVWTLSGDHIYYNAGNVGIGTTIPSALLHTHGTGIGEGNVLFAGGLKLTDPGQPPVSGVGTRMMWYPDKAAFRAGYVSDSQWDQANTGFFSVAMGYSTTASGDYSTAMGRNTIASGKFSSASGFYTIAPSYMETAIGRYNSEYSPNDPNGWIDTDRLFVIGNGASSSLRNNALTILKNGNTGIGISNPANKLEVAGQVKITGGNPGAGKVLTSDASGLASWETSAGLSLPFSGSVNASAAAFQIENTGTDDYTANIGILGSSISGYGVSGLITGESGAGLNGFASATSGSAKAIYGQANAPGAYSGYFQGGRLYVGGNTGIGTSSPIALLHTQGTGTGEGNVVFVGEYKSTTPGAPPVSGAGTRMMWYPDKAAFRAGVVNGTQWDIDNIGDGSAAMGFRTIASGESSTAMGHGTIASGEASTAMGLYTTASEIGSTAMGFGSEALNIGSTAMGYSSSASGHTSTAIGYFAYASGNNSTAMGNFTNAPSAYETVIGRYNTTYTPISTSDWNAADRLFVIGNGTSSVLSNAMTVLKNGNVGIGTSNPTNALSVSGQADISGKLVVGSSTQAGRLLVANADGAANALKIGTSEGDFANLYFLSSGLIFDCYRASDGRRQPIIFQPNGGNVGIGTSAPDYKLDVKGNSRIQLSKTNGEWIAMRTDGSLLDFSFSGNNLAIQGSNDGENIVLNPTRLSKVGIRMWIPMYDLDVNGNIRATGSVYYGGTAGTANGNAYTKPDFVFEEGYDALDPFEVEEFLLKEKHLPWITSAAQEEQENGEVIDMTRMAFETVETVENLQLQIIEQQKTINFLLRRIEALERERSDE